jgi:hypothetical protein
MEYPEHKKIASEYIPEVWKHIKDNEDVRIVTCSEAIVNFLGERIDAGKLLSDEVKILVENTAYYYDEKGCLINWRYGYFLWDWDGDY